jgi:3-oxoacyl-[acyl-carrier-protein] synthase II
LGSKGLRNLDRTTKLICSAAKLALDDANLKITEENADEIGVVTATTLSISWDIAEYTKEMIQEGPQFVSPALFPPATMNFPSSQISIWYKAKGFNTTISTGYTAGLDALKYAVDFIKSKRTKAVLVAGVESLSFSNFVGFYKISFLAGIKGQEVMCPFDIRHNGIIFGEGAVVLVVEEEGYAKERNAQVYAEILSVESFFDAYRASKYDPKASGLKESMLRAIDKAHISEEDIDYICASANSVPQQDRLEIMAIKDVFSIYAKKIPISSIKSMIGESVSASGCFQVAASLGAIKKGFIPPTINHEVPDPNCDLDCVPNVSRRRDIRHVLINNFGPGGNSSTAIISKYV